MNQPGTTERTDDLAALAVRLHKNVSKVFLGKAEVVRSVLTGLLAGGHVLLEDVPGVGKTVLAKSVAKSVDCDFRRVQFTPDLLPSDILGVAVYEQRTGAFEFKPGPIFTNVLLADEINRATPRTQSALLEAMQEGQVTTFGQSRALEQPFMVVATQNPIEMEGTYPLPEAQLDRFMLRIRIGYPSLADEKSVILAQRTQHPIETLEAVLTAKDVERLQHAVREVRLEESVLDYVLALVRKTRASKHLTVGVSPRGSVALSRAAQAHAFLQGRDFVLPDDIKALAVPVLAHRVLGPMMDAEGGQDERERVIQDLVESMSVPV